MWPNPVLVVGTTPDYVVKIQNRYPDTALFLMRDSFEGDPLLATIPDAALVFAPFERFDEILWNTRQFLASKKLQAGAIACFDCEALMTAAKLASALELRFPSPMAISRSRNKFAAKQIWRRHDVRTPAGILAGNLQETLNFFRTLPGDIVLKPVSGSGSELVFFCADEEEVRKSVRILEQELTRRRSNPLFGLLVGEESVDPCSVWMAEEFISGPEFSCDFILNNGRIWIVRSTGKVKATDQTCGTILGYTFPAPFPDGFSTQSLDSLLKSAATALGFDWGYFMADFIIENNQPVLLELTPRPGGDSIPDLVEAATGKDILKIYLDFVAGSLDYGALAGIFPEPCAAVNIFASKEGMITHLDLSDVLAHPSVRNVMLKKNVGDTVKLPPSDYDNRLLGYCLLNAKGGIDLMSVHEDIKNRLRLSLSHPMPQTEAQDA